MLFGFFFFFLPSFSCRPACYCIPTWIKKEKVKKDKGKEKTDVKLIREREWQAGRRGYCTCIYVMYTERIGRLCGRLDDCCGGYLMGGLAKQG